MDFFLDSLELGKTAWDIRSARQKSLDSAVKIDVDGILLRTTRKDSGVSRNDRGKNWVDATLCKGRISCKGFEELQRWFKNKVWHEVDHIKNLRTLMQFTDKHKTINARFPALDEKDGYPGYMDLKKNNNFKGEERTKALTKPFNPWHPYRKIALEIRTVWGKVMLPNQNRRRRNLIQPLKNSEPGKVKCPVLRGLAKSNGLMKRKASAL